MVFSLIQWLESTTSKKNNMFLKRAIKQKTLKHPKKITKDQGHKKNIQHGKMAPKMLQFHGPATSCCNQLLCGHSSPPLRFAGQQIPLEIGNVGLDPMGGWCPKCWGRINYTVYQRLSWEPPSIDSTPYVKKNRTLSKEKGTYLVCSLIT